MEPGLVLRGAILEPSLPATREINPRRAGPIMFSPHVLPMLMNGLSPRRRCRWRLWLPCLRRVASMASAFGFFIIESTARRVFGLCAWAVRCLRVLGGSASLRERLHIYVLR